MKTARIAAVAHYLPSGTLTDEAIGAQQPGWDIEKPSKTAGIRSTPISASGEFSSHMAASAARLLLDSPSVDTDGIDYLILVTQSPDFPLPTTAGLVQDALGLPQHIGAVDVRLGCSGYVYALGLAKGLVVSGQAKKVLLLTADVLTKLVNSNDEVTRPIFGDAATATLVVVAEGVAAGIGSFVYGTDGSGAGALADETLATAGWVPDDVELFVFDRAKFLIDHLRNNPTVEPDMFRRSTNNLGDTGSSTIPLALSQAAAQGILQPGMKVLLAGFGVGLSWAGCTLTW